MKLQISRENIVNPLQQVVGVIERRQTLPILSNVLIKAYEDSIILTGTDLEIQLVSKSQAVVEKPGELTVPARKLLDICRLLPEQSQIVLESHDDAKSAEGEKLRLQVGTRRFHLATLPAENYPEFDDQQYEREIHVNCQSLRKALGKTMFAMAQQDVRYYLNGLMLEFDRGSFRAVASDGHRLSLYEQELEQADDTFRQLILPRKGVLELYRLLGDEEESAVLQLAANSIRLILEKIIFSAKLVDGKFPDYNKVLPREISKTVMVNREEFKQAITRVSILSNEKYKGIGLDIKPQSMRLSAHNPEQEEAEEEVEIHYEGENFSIGFNASYLLDAVVHIDSEQVKLSFTDQNNSCLIEDMENAKMKFIVMPMRL